MAAARSLAASAPVDAPKCPRCHDTGRHAPEGVCASHGYAACPFCGVVCSCPAGDARVRDAKGGAS